MFWKYYFLFNLSYYIPSIILFILDMFKAYTRTQNIDNIINVYVKCIPRILINTIIFTIPPIYTIILLTNIFNFNF